MKTASCPTLGPPSGPGSNKFPPRPLTNAPTCGAPVFYDLPPVDVVYPREVMKITLGPPEGPGSSTSPQRGPLSAATEGADVFYELPPVTTVKPRIEFGFSFTGADGRGDLPRSETQASFMNYEGELTHPDVIKPTVNRQMTFGKAAQRAEPNEDLTKASFHAYRNICTPATYKHTRMPARRFAPGPGYPINPRFRSSPDLTQGSYLTHSPSQKEIRRRDRSAIMTGSVRSAIMDARMELRSCHELMRF